MHIEKSKMLDLLNWLRERVTTDYYGDGEINATLAIDDLTEAVEEESTD